MSKTEEHSLQLGIKGVFKMTVRNNVTGEILEEYEDNNIVLNQGKEFLLQALNVRDTNQFTMNTIKIGDDVGTGGTVLDPAAPTGTNNESNQDVIYTIPTEEFFITYPEFNQVNYFATVNGAEVMSNFPSEPNKIYTSAVLYTLDDKAFAYKRFPARTLSNLISVDISWTLTIN